jgi:hypothetical protein
VRKRRTRIDGNNADRFPGGPRDGDERGAERRLPDAGRPGEADRHGATGPLEHGVHERGTATGFGL